MEPDDLSSPHDRLFKHAFGRRESAAAFFQAYLPPGLTSLIQWESLQLAPGSFIDQALRHQESDLLYTAEFQSGPMCLYCLFEHQSTVDAKMPLRLLKYMVQIWEQCLKAEPGREKLPPIFPLVLYQGRDAWRVSPRFMDLLGLPPGAAELHRFQPAFEHALVDLSQLRVEEIRGDLIGRLTLQMMRAVAQGEVFAWLERAGPLFVELLRQGSPSGILEAFLRYLFQADTDVTYAKFSEVIAKTKTTELESGAMSIAEELIQKGIEKGIEQGLEQGLEQGIEQGIEKGMEKGRQEGTLIGKIQFAQQALRLPVIRSAQLEQKTIPELERLLQELEEQFHQRFQ